MYIYSFLVDVMLASLQQLLENLLERSAKETVPWQVTFALVPIIAPSYFEMQELCYFNYHGYVFIYTFIRHGDRLQYNKDPDKQTNRQTDRQTLQLIPQHHSNAHSIKERKIT